MPEPTTGGPGDPGAMSAGVVDVVSAGFGTTSRAALRRLLDTLDEVERAGGEDLESMGDGLRAVAALLDAEPGLRRALTDASREGADRAGLAHRILDGRIAAPVAQLTADAAADRWSAPRDLLDGLDVAATVAEVAAAARVGSLDDLEDDIFRFSRIVGGDNELRSALSDSRAPRASRSQLVRRLLADRVSAAAVRLVVAAVTDVRGRSLETALHEVESLIAARRDRVVAVVRVAAPLTPRQRTDLINRIAQTVGHTVQLNVVEDPSVLGGFRAEVGDTVIDASVASRLADARRRLVG